MSISSSISRPSSRSIKSSILGHFPLLSGETPPPVENPYPNSFYQGWNEPIKMDGIIYLDQILGQQ
jgi:hypothetical protein